MNSPETLKLTVKKEHPKNCLQVQIACLLCYLREEDKRKTRYWTFWSHLLAPTNLTKMRC